MAGRIWGGTLLGHRVELSIKPLPEPDEYWLVERMTHRGGWERVARFDDGPPPEKAPLAITPPSRIRCVRRRGGPIDNDGVEWASEHPKAAERYERLRFRAEVEEAIEEIREEREAEGEADQEPDDRFAERVLDAVLAGDLDDADPDAIESVKELAEVRSALRPSPFEQMLSEEDSGAGDDGQD